MYAPSKITLYADASNNSEKSLSNNRELPRFIEKTVALQLRKLCIIDYALLAASKIPPSCHSAKCVNVSWYFLNAVFGVEPFFIQTNGLSKALK